MLECCTRLFGHIEHGGLVLMEKPTEDIAPPVKFPEPGDKSEMFWMD